MHPIETGNVILMVVGVLLEIGGITINYRTIFGLMRLRREEPEADMHWGSNAVNVLIGVVFMIAGVLFVINNLRGNPLV